MPLVTVIADDDTGLNELSAAWDALAVRAGRPFGAPPWCLAWARHVAPRSGTARVVAILDGDQAVAVAPLYAGRAFAGRSVYEVMAARISPPAGLLLDPGRESEGGEALARALANLRPRLAALRFWDRVEGGIAGSIAANSSSRPAWRHTDNPTPLPVVVLDGLDFDAWMARRSSKFRQESRRLRRRLDDTGATFTLVGAEDLDRALAAFVDLHGSRWEDRGGSNALVSGFEEMFRAAASGEPSLGLDRKELLGAGRMRIIVAVNILLAAGSAVAGWNSGFDQEWHRYSPSLQLTLHAVADSAARGERRINLGPGRMGYKARLADEEEPVAMTSLVPRGREYLLSRVRFAPIQARREVARRLSSAHKDQIRGKLRGPLQSFRRVRPPR